MAYFREFLARINKQDKKGFQELWHEYCAGDEIDSEEYLRILTAIKGTPFVKDFDLQTALELLDKTDKQYEALFAAIIDLQTDNSPELAEKAYAFLEKHYGKLDHFQDKIRLVGLKTRTHFQGAITNFLLLNHLQKGKFVFHQGGWGVGEVMNVSMVREQAEIEFEKVSGKREISFANAFKTLSPLPDDHFLARRFGNPDKLEKEAKEDPASVICVLLRDLGPKTAAEIKEALSEYVIPEEEWNKWWQSAKAKLKKEQTIEMPESAKEPFRLTNEQRSVDEKVLKALEKCHNTKTFIETLYTNLRDHSRIIDNETLRVDLLGKVLEASGTTSEQLSLLFLRDDLMDSKSKDLIHKLLAASENVITLIKDVEILAFKKRAVVELKAARSDWQALYLELLGAAVPTTIREYVLKESREGLSEAVASFLDKSDFLFWYLPKAMADKTLPFSDKTGQCCLLEAYLVLLAQETNRDLSKKMQALLFADRFLVVRTILEGASKEFIKEFLLLVSKCHTIADFDSQTLYSLAYVVYPDLNKKGKNVPETEETVNWTTAEGLHKLQERLKQIGTVETVENAREIEAARALGDLRENAEFKFALEKRARLQTELKTLGEQLQQIRILTKADIPQDEVGIGSVVFLENERGEKTTYTILGPYDADSEKGILAFQSKLAQSMVGLKVGDKFSFQKDHYRITDIKSYL